MSNQITSPELSEKSIFDQIFQLIERHDLSVSKTFSLGDFYDTVSNFDMKFQKFNTDKKHKSVKIIYNNLLEKTFNNFLTIFHVKGFNNEPIFFAFERFIIFFSFILEESTSEKLKSHILKNLFENFPSLNINIKDKIDDALELYVHNYSQAENETQKMILKFENYFPYEIGLLFDDSGKNTSKKNEKIFQVYTNGFIAKEIQWVKSKKSYNVISEIYYMTLDIEINSNDVSVEKLLTPLWLITSALERIKNVTVELVQIHKGSLRATIKIWIKDLVAKEETKAILEAGKEGVIKALSGGVSHADTKKKNSETKKINAETKKIEEEINQMPTIDETKLTRALDIQKKSLENDLQEVILAKAKLDLIEQLSDLTKKGIIEADTIRIDINEVLYILKKDNDIKEIGPDISEIS
jgi:hypothetical protein